MSAALSSEGPAPAGLAQGLLELGDLRRQGCLTAEQYGLQVKHLIREFSTPDLPPLSNGANGAIVAKATPADASAAASFVVPAGDGRSPSGDSSDCGLHDTSVPLDGAAIGTPRSLFDDVGGCLASPSKEGHPMGALSTAALTDDGGRPPDPRANAGPVPGAPAWDGRLSESSSRLASIVAHRKGNSSAHDSSINAAASASPSPGQLNQPIKDSKSTRAVICMAENPVNRKSSRHIDTRRHFIGELVAAGTVKLADCRTDEMVADALTKSLPYPSFKKHRTTMMGEDVKQAKVYQIVMQVG